MYNFDFRLGYFVDYESSDIKITSNYSFFYWYIIIDTLNNNNKLILSSLLMLNKNKISIIYRPFSFMSSIFNLSKLSFKNNFILTQIIWQIVFLIINMLFNNFHINLNISFSFAYKSIFYFHFIDSTWFIICFFPIRTRIDLKNFVHCIVSFDL